MRVGIVYKKDGVIWVSFRGSGRYLPQVSSLVVFTDFEGFRNSIKIVGGEKFMGKIGTDEILTHFSDFDKLADTIWPIIKPLITSDDLDFNWDMKHHRFVVTGSWRVYVHSLTGDFYPSGSH